MKVIKIEYKGSSGVSLHDGGGVRVWGMRQEVQQVRHLPEAQVQGP